MRLSKALPIYAAKKKRLQIYGKIALLCFDGTNLMGFCEENWYHQGHLMIS
jgi:hypothetical protein